MDNIVFLVLRRMRMPLLALVVVWSVAILGFVLIPGRDDAGNPWHMDFFHAFYFVSYMATTIGFGEIPYPFVPAQRLWTLVTIYSTVIVWIYSIGTLISLAQDSVFRHALNERRFAWRIRRMTEPFLLVCGYGEAGEAMVRSAIYRGQAVVVVERDPERINALQLGNLRVAVPYLQADASVPQHLIEAGLRHRRCTGVVALTDVNEVNLKIAISSKLLRPELKVVCSSDSHDVEANMVSFGTDHVIDPYDTFSLLLAIALEAPCHHLLHTWLSGMEGEGLRDPVYPPHKGLWVVCGYGRFGKSVYRRLKGEGIRTVVVEADPGKTGMPQEGGVLGRGTEAHTLTEAGIERAVALVAGTDDDTNNLSIVMTAKEMNPRLFVVVRQNLSSNQQLFSAVEADIVMHPSSIIANKIRVLLGTPLLYRFLSLARFEEDQWACQLISRISGLVSTNVPEVWEVGINETDAYAVARLLRSGQNLALRHLLHDPRERKRPLACIPLLVEREGEYTVLPEGNTALLVGDRLLFCGTERSRRALGWNLMNQNALRYIRTGKVQEPGRVWQYLRESLGRRQRR